MLAIICILAFVAGAGLIIFIANYKVKQDDLKFDTSEQRSEHQKKIVAPHNVSHISGFWPEIINPPTVETNIFTRQQKKPVKEQLNDQLNAALEIEDYELAARLRDKINKLK